MKGGWNRRKGYMMSRTKWNETEKRTEGAETALKVGTETRGSREPRQGKQGTDKAPGTRLGGIGHSVDETYPIKLSIYASIKKTLLLKKKLDSTFFLFFVHCAVIEGSQQRSSRRGP